MNKLQDLEKIQKLEFVAFMEDQINTNKEKKLQKVHSLIIFIKQK